MAFPFNGRRDSENEYWDFYNNKVSGTCTAMAGQGVLGSVFVNGGTYGLLTITDNTGATGGALIAQFTPSVTGESFNFSVRCRYGCSIFASAATNYTVTYLR